MSKLSTRRKGKGSREGSKCFALSTVLQEQTITAIQSMIDAIYAAYHIALGASEEQMVLSRSA